MKQNPGKVKTVMHEFKAGKLKSSSGQKVTNPKQAVAIAMSEAGMSKKAKKFGKGGVTEFGDDDMSADIPPPKKPAKSAKPVAPPKPTTKKKYIEFGDDDMSATSYAKGGKVEESKAMAKKEISFMQRKGAPKSMIKHEKEEYGMKRGGKVKKFAAGGNVKKMADGGATAGVNPRAMAAAVRPPMAPRTPLGTMPPLPSRPPMPMPRSDRTNPMPPPQVRTGMGGAASQVPLGRALAGAYGAGQIPAALGNALVDAYGAGATAPAFKKGGSVKKGCGMKKGGSIDGIAKKGKTNTKHYAKGGSVSSRADGIASKGKTNCKMR